MNDRISFRTSPIPSLQALIDRAATRARRERSDWIRQVLYDVATAEIQGVDVHEVLKVAARSTRSIRDSLTIGQK